MKNFILTITGIAFLITGLVFLIKENNKSKNINKTEIDGTYVKPNYIIDLIKDTDSVYIKTNDTIYKVPFNKIEETINLDTP